MGAAPVEHGSQPLAQFVKEFGRKHAIAPYTRLGPRNRSKIDVGPNECGDWIPVERRVRSRSSLLCVLRPYLAEPLRCSGRCSGRSDRGTTFAGETPCSVRDVGGTVFVLGRDLETEHVLKVTVGEFVEAKDATVGLGASICYVYTAQHGFT